jgi:hypothetical protein
MFDVFLRILKKFPYFDFFVMGKLLKYHFQK